MGNSRGNILAQAGLDLSNFESGVSKFITGVSKIEKSGQKADQSLKKLGDNKILQGDNKAERNISGLASELLGAGSAADVAGAALGRLPNIFQGSLLIGAAAGIGKAILEWAQNAEKAKLELQQLEKIVARQQANVSALVSGSEGAQKQITDSIRRRTGGDEFADSAKREEDHQEKIKQIREQYGSRGSNFEKLEDKRYAEQEKLIESRKDAEINAAREVEKEEIRKQEIANDNLAAQTAGLSVDKSDLQEIIRLRKQEEAITKRRDNSKGEMDYLRIENERLEKVKEIQGLEEKASAVGEASLKSYRQTLNNEVLQGWQNIVSKVKEVEKISAQIVQDNKDQVAEANKLKKAQDDYINNAVKNQRMTPQEKSAAKKEERANNRAIRQIEGRESEQARNDALNHRQRVPDHVTPTTDQARKNIVDRHAKEIKSLTVDNLTVTTIKTK